jgi:NAD(P)-dependent dehydrogenase (short-subunit alcohol dehydrogenase family)
MTILITGGTSGLGLQLSKCLLKKGYNIVITGRKNNLTRETNKNLTFIRTDFCNLRQTAEVAKKLCADYRFDIIINNAGVLSPPGLMLTDNRIEYSFQVNFLSHLLLNEIIIRNLDPGFSIKIAATLSVVYRIANIDKDPFILNNDYRPFRAYSKSKLCLALMCSWLPLKYQGHDMRCFGFDPGVFSSGIFRMQNEWFRVMYRVAAPFMRDPANIAKAYCDLLERDDLVNGAVYKPGRLTGRIPETSHGKLSSFFEGCYKIIEPYIL